LYFAIELCGFVTQTELKELMKEWIDWCWV